MKRYILLFLALFVVQYSSNAQESIQINSVTNNLPSIKITSPVTNIQTTRTVSQPAAKPVQKTVFQQAASKKVPQKAFNPKGSGMTNYQYDDTYYKYNKYEKFIKDNIDYSKTGRTKIY